MKKIFNIKSMFSVLMVSFCLVATGCSSESEESNVTSESGKLPSGEGKVSYPITLESPWGETVLEERPERIAVVTTTSDAENLLSLDVEPVFLYDIYKNKDYLKDNEKAQNVEYTSESAGPNTKNADLPYEEIAKSNPDLIIAVQAAGFEGFYSELSRIAPVLTGPNPSSSVSWEESLQQIAGAIDLEDRAQGIINENHRILQSVLDPYPELKGKSLAFLMQHPTAGLQIRSLEGSAVVSVIEEMGMTLPDFAKNTTEVSVSEENFPSIDADALIMYSSAKTEKEFEDNSLFRSIPAVRDGAFAFSDQTLYSYATLWPTALSIPYVVRESLEPAFKEISEGMTAS